MAIVQIDEKSNYELVECLNEVQKSYASALLLFESGNLGAAHLIAGRTIFLLSRLIEQFSASKDQINQRLNRENLNLIEDVKAFSDIDLKSGIAKPSPDPAHLMILIEKIKKYVDIVSENMKSVYDLRPQWQKNIRNIFMASKRFLLQHPWISLGSAGVLLSLIIFLVHAHVQDSKRHGLIGEYFSDVKFTNLVEKKKDPKIDFDWGEGGPSENMRRTANDFSIRWTGFLYVPVSRNYNFTTRSDDGVRVWIDDKLVIDDWIGHWAQFSTASLYLEKGLHPIKVDFYEQGKFATMKLYWSNEENPKKRIISKKFLYPRADAYQGH